MKNLHVNLDSRWIGKTERVSFCSVASEAQSITIAGQTLVPNEDNAYVEFFLSNAYPVRTLYRTAIMPAVVANSFSTLNYKVFDYAHLLRKYNPEKIARDRILGTVVAVEFTGSGIRAVAVMHKAAEGVIDILTSWFSGTAPMGSEWSVSMENSFHEDEGGFLVKAESANQKTHLAAFLAATPASLLAEDYVYVPAMTAPEGLLGCLNNDADDRRDGINSARVVRDYNGQEVVFLLGGLDGKIRYRGVGLTLADGAREAEARVSTMLASAPMVDVTDALLPLTKFHSGLAK
jgi:hypothetical protein